MNGFKLDLKIELHQDIAKAVKYGDHKYDGKYYLTIIKRSKYFCKPSCKSKKLVDDSKNFKFFKCIRDAKLSGLKPCKRCKADDLTKCTPKARIDQQKKFIRDFVWKYNKPPKSFQVYAASNISNFHGYRKNKDLKFHVKAYGKMCLAKKLAGYSKDFDNDSYIEYEDTDPVFKDFSKPSSKSNESKLIIQDSNDLIGEEFFDLLDSAETRSSDSSETSSLQSIDFTNFENQTFSSCSTFPTEFQAERNDYQSFSKNIHDSFNFNSFPLIPSSIKTSEVSHEAFWTNELESNETNNFESCFSVSEELYSEKEFYKEFYDHSSILDFFYDLP